MRGTSVESSIIAYSFSCWLVVHNASSHRQKHSFVSWVIASVDRLEAAHTLADCDFFVGNQSADHSCQCPWLKLRPWILDGKVYICLNGVILLVHWDVSAVFHGAKIESFLVLIIFIVHFLAFAWMVTMESHQFGLLKLRNQNQALIAFLTLHKVDLLYELRTCCVNFVLFFLTFVHLVIVVFNKELAWRKSKSFAMIQVPLWSVKCSGDSVLDDLRCLHGFIDTLNAYVALGKIVLWLMRKGIWLIDIW